MADRIHTQRDLAVEYVLLALVMQLRIEIKYLLIEHTISNAATL